MKRGRGYGVPNWSPQPEIVFLYVATCEGFCKVGVSASPTKRIAGMQTESPFAVRLIATRRVHRLGASAGELFAHQLLEAVAHRGEWFRCSTEEAVRAISIGAQRGHREGVAMSRSIAAEAETFQSRSQQISVPLRLVSSITD